MRGACNGKYVKEVVYLLTGIIENPISTEQHIRNCQTVINLIATDVLNVDLSHISGKAIVEGDKVSIRNFLEIFAGLLEYFMEYVDDEGTHVCMPLHVGLHQSVNQHSLPMAAGP